MEFVFEYIWMALFCIYAWNGMIAHSRKENMDFTNLVLLTHTDTDQTKVASIYAGMTSDCF